MRPCQHESCSALQARPCTVGRAPADGEEITLRTPCPSACEHQPRSQSEGGRAGCGARGAAKDARSACPQSAHQAGRESWHTVESDQRPVATKNCTRRLGGANQRPAVLGRTVHYQTGYASGTAAEARTVRERGEVGTEPRRVKARGGRALASQHAWARGITTRGATRESAAAPRAGPSAGRTGQRGASSGPALV